LCQVLRRRTLWPCRLEMGLNVRSVRRGGAVSNARPRRWPPRGLGAIPEGAAAYAAADGGVSAGGFAVDWDVQLG